MIGLYLRLYYEFFKTGLFAVGGGLATLPFLSDLSDRTGWFTQAQLADMVAVAESTPGPIGINTATYVGFVTAGIPGGIIATLGLISPSIFIIIMISAALRAFRDNRYVNAVFAVLRPISMGLILSSGLAFALVALFHETMSFPASINVRAWLLAAVLLVFVMFVKKTKGWHPIVWIGLSALVGILFF